MATTALDPILVAGGGLGILLDACKANSDIEFMPLTSVIGYEDLGDKVRLRTQSDKCIEGVAIVGADGLRSTVRQQMVREGEPRMIGFVAHRTIVPMSEVSADIRRNDVVLWSGPGFHIVHYPLRAGTLFNIVAVFETSSYLERGDIGSYRAEIERTYCNSHPSMKALLSMMDVARRWAISDRDPIRHWSKGRVTLLGDAAHPTLQTLAQGACMAIEDAVCLAQLLDQANGDFVSAFRRYEAARYLRTARVQFESRYHWIVFIMSPASSAKWHEKSGPSVAKRRCSSAWPGCTMALRYRCRLRSQLIDCLEAIIIRETKQWSVG
jgi:2-polyprenyl-6-methoxyphenol hydroxylase-like FAD-dependent oxidoreductase